MTKREAAIVSAYTGYLIGDFYEMHKYCDELLGRSIFTHEFGSKDVMDEIHEKSKEDFCNIQIEERTNTNNELCDHWECPYYCRCTKHGKEVDNCMSYMDI